MSHQEPNQPVADLNPVNPLKKQKPLRHPLTMALFSLLAGFSTNVLAQEGEVPEVSTVKGGVIDLSKVVVTASGYEQSIKEAPASISIITAAELAQEPGEGLGAMLGGVEGVMIEQGGKSGGADIGIRGLPSDYTLLLIDGKRLSQNSSGARPNGFGDVDSSFIPPRSAIERIEVVRGPMSTLYGSDALGGVINVITKKVPDQWGGEISANTAIPTSNDFGGEGGISLYAAGPLKEDKLGLALMGSLQHRGNAKGRYATNPTERASGIYTGSYANFTGLGARKNYNVGARLSYTPTDQHDLLFTIDHGVQRVDNSEGQLGTLNSDVALGKAGGGYSEELRFNRTRYALSHEGRLGFATVNSSLLWDTTETLGRLNPVQAIPDPAIDGTARDIKYRNLVFDHTWQFALGENHFITAGGQYRTQKLTDTLHSAPVDVKQWHWALFLEDEWILQDNLVATLGLRYDHNELFGSHFSPRAYLLWEINDNWQIKGGVSRAFRAPDVNLMTDDIIGLGRQGTLPLLGNSDLQPETSTSLELALGYDNNENFSTTATLFYTKFKDKIDSVDVPNCAINPVAGCVDLGAGWDVENFSQRMNLDSAKLYGLELGAKYQFNDQLGLSANYTYTDSSYRTDEGRKLPFSSTPRHMVNLKADYQINERWNLWVEGQYRAKQYDGLHKDDESKVYYRSYLIANVGTRYESTDQLSFSAGVHNLFDKDFAKYEEALTPQRGDTYRNRYYRLREGRKIWANITYNF